MAWTERYMDAATSGGGDGTTTATSGANAAWTLAEAIAAVTGSGVRINVKAGTYAQTTNNRTLAGAGIDTAPVWWRGYNTTPGDLDEGANLTKPSITFGNASLTIGGSHQWFTGINVTSARTTTAAVISSGGYNRIVRCRMENTNAASASRAFQFATAGNGFIRACYLKTTSSAGGGSSSVSSFWRNCVFDSGDFGLALSGTPSHIVTGCLFINQVSYGIGFSGTGITVCERNTFYNTPIGVDYSGSVIGSTNSANIYSVCSTAGIRNSTGGDLNRTERNNNLFHSCTANESGWGDSPSFGTQTDSSSPFTNAASGDFSIISTSNAKGTGAGLLENQSYTSYLDIGAVQRQEPSSSGAGIPGNLGGGILQ